MCALQAYKGERPSNPLPAIPSTRWSFTILAATADATSTTQVDFFQTNGSTITNTISVGQNLDPTDLHMTYCFEWRHPELQEGSDTTELFKKHQGMAKMAVDKSIEACRRLVQEGAIA